MWTNTTGTSKYLNRNVAENKSLNKISNKFMLIAVVVGVLNSSLYSNIIASLILVLIETFILGYCFFKNNLAKYLSYYLIFLCLSLEFDVLVGSSYFYGFKNFRILGVNLGILFLIPPAIKLIIKGIKLKGIKVNFPTVYKFTVLIGVLSALGVAIGLFTLEINDNNIQNLANPVIALINECYSMMALPILILFAFIYILKYEKDKITLLKEALIAILVAIPFSMIASLLLGNRGYYGGVETMLVSNVMMYIPFLLMFPFYGELKSPIFVSMFALVGVGLSLIYNASGKLILLCMLVPFIIIMTLWKRNKRVFGLIAIFITTIVIILAVQYIGILGEENILFNSKYNQVFGLLTFWEPNWLENMPGSPRFRVAEFLNIAIELFKKPWFIPLGKGYMGSISDHLHMFGGSYLAGTFSEAEWSNSSFYSMHETLNSFFLCYGLFGLGVYFYILKKTLKYFLKSPWIFMGSFWFLMLYGYSITISAFGIVCLLIGLYEIDEKVKYKVHH